MKAQKTWHPAKNQTRVWMRYETVCATVDELAYEQQHKMHQSYMKQQQGPKSEPDAHSAFYFPTFLNLQHWFHIRLHKPFHTCSLLNMPSESMFYGILMLCQVPKAAHVRKYWHHKSVAHSSVFYVCYMAKQTFRRTLTMQDSTLGIQVLYP